MYISNTPYHTLCSRFHYIHISLSAYMTFCAVDFTIRRISVSADITRCAVVFTIQRISVYIRFRFIHSNTGNIFGGIRRRPLKTINGP